MPLALSTKRSRPLPVSMPPAGVLFAESMHAGDFQMAPRIDPFHKLLYVLRGGLSYVEKNHQAESVSAGMLLVIPAGVEHQVLDRQPSTLFLLCFSPSFLENAPDLPPIWSDLAARSKRRIGLSRPTRQQVETAWRKALLERIQPRPGSLTLTRSLAAQLLVTLVRLSVIKPAVDPRSRVGAVAREMEQTFYDPWNLDEAAARAGMSRRHFSMLFREVCGCTFWEYLTNLRLAHATQLLRQGSHSVTGVVFACGFGDVTQFYRLFRLRFHQPPKRWALTGGQALPTPSPSPARSAEETARPVRPIDRS